MRVALAFAGPVIAVCLLAGCDSGGAGGNTNTYGAYHNQWDSMDPHSRYDHQYRDARPAGGMMDPNYSRGWDQE